MMGGSKIKVDPNAVHSGERHERDAHGEMPIDDADEMIDEAQDTAEEVIDDATNAAEDMIDDASENLPDSP